MSVFIFEASLTPGQLTSVYLWLGLVIYYPYESSNTLRTWPLQDKIRRLPIPVTLLSAYLLFLGSFVGGTEPPHFGKVISGSPSVGTLRR